MHTGEVDTPQRTRWRSALVNVAILVGTLFATASAVGTTTVRDHPGSASGDADSAEVLFFFLSFACAILLCFRHRRGALLPAALVACLPPLLLPVDALAALIGLASVCVWVRPVAPRIVVGLVTTAAVAASIWRDTRGTRPGASFWNSMFHSASHTSWPRMPLWQVLVLTGLCVGASVGIAALRRSRRQVDAADAQARAATNTARSLSRQVAEQDEREALAREVHDRLGHRLSILSMQASALEVEAAEADVEVRERARSIQAGAASSMDDLRSLLHQLRTGPEHRQDGASLDDVANLVRECIDAGTPVASSIFVESSATLDPDVGHCAHRIVTELLTNARKHAPGRTVVLDVRGDPAHGLTIFTSNPVVHGSGASGTGSGLSGAAARAHDVGGGLSAGLSPDSRHFIATARLPWRPTHAEHRL